VTTNEAAELALDLTHQLRAIRAERDAYRLVAYRAIAYASTLLRDLTRTEERYHRLLDERRSIGQTTEAA
jgi:hypothetical protein